MVIENIPHNPESSKQKTTPLSPVSQLPPEEYIISEDQKGWVEFIDMLSPYEWFCHLTFKNDIHPNEANRRFHVWIRNINKHLYGGNWRRKKKGTTWIKCMERQKRDVIHFHCLVGSPELYTLEPLKFMKLWETNCGQILYKYIADPHRFDRIFTGSFPIYEGWLMNGFARIHKYDSSKDGKYYVSKYVTKGCDNIEYDMPPSKWDLLINKQQGRLAFNN